MEQEPSGISGQPPNAINENWRVAEEKIHVTTDTTERGLERLICTALTGHACDPPQAGAVHERPATYGVGWIGGDPNGYDREYCVDLAQLATF